MAVYKCKMCGGDLSITDMDKVVACDYCGTTQTVPTADSEKKLTLFNRANRLRLAGEFDKASGIYENIVAEFPEEAEAYWGLCLCNYGIEYVDDPATGKKIPTCHRASFQKLREDENFELAMEYADVIAQKVYRDEAREIDRINEEILSVSRNESPYDVFICYKETDEAGERTPDSVMAQDIYDALTAKGLKVFFARISLESKLGQQYEPYIFAALNSAKIMLCVGTRYEYFHAVWVKNEWGRFLRLAAKDKSKALIPCYKDMDPYDLPDAFKGLQAQDLGKLGAIQDLVRGVEKLLGKDSKPVVVANPSTEGALAKRGYLFLEDNDFITADSYFERALDENPENSKAYLGKVLCRLRITSVDEMNGILWDPDSFRDFVRAIRFSSGIEKDALLSIFETAKKKYYLKCFSSCISRYVKKLEQEERLRIEREDRRIEEEKRRREEELRKQTEAEAEREAEKVIAAFQREREKAEQETLTQRLSSIRKEISTLEAICGGYDAARIGYEGATAALKRIEKQETALRADRKKLGLLAGKDKKRIETELTMLAAQSQELKKKAETLSKKMGAFENKQQATQALAIAQKTEADLQNRIDFINRQAEGEFTAKEALELYIKDLRIQKIVAGKDPVLSVRLAFKTDCDHVFFGNYPQESETDCSPIEWLILDRVASKALLISKYALDCQKYNNWNSDMIWENCSLRSWLNEAFYNEAFDASHQKMIVSSTVIADINPSYSTSNRNNTTDKVFLLGITEVNKYFDSDRARHCIGTAYGVKRGIYRNSSECRWWLRTPGWGPKGLTSSRTTTVRGSGDVDLFGRYVSDYNAVRPALWIDLDA